MQTEAKVLILMNGDHKLTTADLNQLAGRGTRSQTIPTATLIAIKPLKGANAQSIITKNDEGGAVNHVPDNVKRLYDRWSSLSSKDTKKRTRIIAVLKDEGWMQEEWKLTTEDRNWLYGVTDSYKKK